MPDLSFETEILQKDKRLIVGLDEAGRGALAGPVVAGAVILPLGDQNKLDQLADVNDSKQLSAQKRATFYDLIITYAQAWGVGIVSAQDIDRIGIIPATKRSMHLALGNLQLPEGEAIDYALIDGRIKLQDLPIPQRSIIKGDTLSLSIAAASIIAKVTRDRILESAAVNWPLYRLEQHKGYGTKLHRELIKTYGGTPFHRHSFAPLKKRLLDGQEGACDQAIKS